jgi:hypothetical protein
MNVTEDRSDNKAEKGKRYATTNKTSPESTLALEKPYPKKKVKRKQKRKRCFTPDDVSNPENTSKRKLGFKSGHESLEQTNPAVRNLVVGKLR